MAIYFETNDPARLLRTFKKAIDDKHVVTWSYDQDGDFTHTPDQWQNKAWLKPTVEAGRLRMNVVPNKRYVTTKAIYGVYHGRFIESMVTHCQDLFDRATATAKATNSDGITTTAAA